jgi:NAD(P)-dependent dehydrogenase (short-subunit alcohol dehydrogenase family)
MSNNILIIGGGDIAAEGIVPVVGGILVDKSNCDVRDYEQLEDVFNKHSPNVMIYTAGISHVSSILDSDPEKWREEIEINVLGAYHAAKISAKNGVETQIFITSVAGLYGKPNHSGYSSSKSALISLVQSLGMEGYNAYGIAPGRVHTKMRERDYPGEDPKTRLAPINIGKVVQEILANKFEPGDNIIIRKRGYRTLRRVDKGKPWREYLKVGEPPVC